MVTCWVKESRAKVHVRNSQMIVALEITKAQSCIIRHVKRQFSSCFEVEEEIKVVVCRFC